MENTSKKNLLYQFDIQMQGIRSHIESIETIEDVELDSINQVIESLEGIKEIKVALATLKN